MKKLVKMFALAVMMIFCSQAMAQTRGAMFLGASFPMSDFADFEGIRDFALVSTDHDEDDAGAAIGFNTGLKWYYNVGVKGLGVMLSVDGFYNGPNSDLKTAYRNGEGSMGNQWAGGSYTYKATPKYINVPVMLGLNYMFRINPQLGLYVEAGAGGNLRFITGMESVLESHVSSVWGKYKITTSYDKALSFAYQAGIGFEVAKNLVVGCSFYDLGAAPVTCEQKTKLVDGSATYLDDTDYKEFGTVHPIMILGRIGFSF